MGHELGNELFAVVQQVQPELAPKLTGMLLQLGEEECWACLEDHEKLAVRLDEAMAILDGVHAEASSAPRRPPAETRLDPDDGVARTFAELQKHYAGQYSAQEIKEYWDHCKAKAASAKEAPAAKATRTAPQQPAAKAKAPAKAPAAKAPAAKAPAAKAPIAKAPEAKAPAAKAPAAKAPAAQQPAAKVPAKSPPAKEVIPGLRAWLAKLQLEPYLSAAEHWAEDQGAVSLEEIVEFGEDFAQDLKMKALEKKRVVEAGEAAMKEVEAMSPEPESDHYGDEDGDGDDDDFHEGRNAQLDTERDIAALSRVDVEPMDPDPPRPAPRARPAAPAPAPVAPAAPREQPEQRRYARGQGFGGEENGATGGYFNHKGSSSGEEKRVDPEDGKAKTFKELQAEYTHLYSPQEISEYWQECAPDSADSTAAPKPAPAPAARAPPGLTPGKSQPWGAGGSKLRF